MSKNIKVVCFGEILYDILPGSELPGGAPLNVALRLSSLGVDAEIISRVGVDARGEKLLDHLRKHGVETGNIVKDETLSTGSAVVNLQEDGEANYHIEYPAAWDRIEASSTIEKSVSKCDAFIFGSLICRDDVSRKTLFGLIPKAAYRVLDFNLRAPHYSKDLLAEIVQHAEFIQFNDDELFEVARILGSEYHSLEQNLLFMAVKTNAETICVTKGAHGAVLMHDKKLYYNSGYRVKVRDTVGAGDSFLATILAKLLQGDKPQVALDKACAMGALVAAKEGANPEISDELLYRFMNPMDARKTAK